MTRLGSGLSLANTLQVGMGGSGKGIRFANSNTYIKEASNTELEVYVGGGHSLTFENDGGILHGTWTINSATVTSDRRLKKDIVPLQRTLRDVIAPKGDQKGTGKSITELEGGAQGDGALWLLRQLRPVSYSFRKGADSKNMRFGFIADELETVVPQVVRRTDRKSNDVDNQASVVYQDLIALLTAATQSQQHVIESQRSKMDELETYQSDLTEQTRKLIEEVKQMKIEEERLEREEQERQRRMRKRKKRFRSF